ncbi:hypothetical protein Sgly_3152 [Syntrophobotulus glycolicus DSM 8271]|uniref:Uncharacterized protein n=1 Tax=Syntrophobotulus glycolicus (strain DSM 8271 / FlGlyR) TaxID=645991 RepID=F0SX49_SYNGF|nr:hypothetical protein [Syntrophobotulus glycolicus]ADY54893.1 hypothetical protein Sgly_0528 [Syntrophobotulus glycolicus DSM 8271]ADY56909.1 hypothetical protein Sgly_2630 [Syntrophobotulus glycolicus DSM 8271]ADY57246.1 hypothetical protein Sgly_2977 [Syntrophobotulus glycolicus DSM 8271]ADY57418.1 hypothetical protein Sgly_3152 [Syntrophobotulus glycolicus DSM 8271]
MPGKTKKPKKMTAREKAARAEAKKRLQEKGVIPPDKPKLNRKKFAKEILTEWEAAEEKADLAFYLYQAVFNMVGKDMREVTPEQVGVLKALKIALETRKFTEALKAEGRAQYTIGEYVDKVFAPIMRL